MCGSPGRYVGVGFTLLPPPHVYVTFPGGEPGPVGLRPVPSAPGLVLGELGAHAKPGPLLLVSQPRSPSVQEGGKCCEQAKKRLACRVLGSKELQLPASLLETFHSDCDAGAAADGSEPVKC